MEKDNDNYKFANDYAAICHIESMPFREVESIFQWLAAPGYEGGKTNDKEIIKDMKFHVLYYTHTDIQHACLLSAVFQEELKITLKMHFYLETISFVCYDVTKKSSNLKFSNFLLFFFYTR